MRERPFPPRLSLPMFEGLASRGAVGTPAGAGRETAPHPHEGQQAGAEGGPAVTQGAPVPPSPPRGRGTTGPSSARPPRLRTPRPSHPRAAAPPCGSAPPLRARYSGYCSPRTRFHRRVTRCGNYTSRRSARCGLPRRRAVLLRPARRSPPRRAWCPGAARGGGGSVRQSSAWRSRRRRSAARRCGGAQGRAGLRGPGGAAMRHRGTRRVPGGAGALSSP